MYENLPDELKRNGRFCLWRYESRGDKPTKVPYRTDGRRADSTKTSDFSSFEAVTAALGRGGCDGIGMMVGGGFSAVDIDHCVDGGKLSETARDVVETMDSYTETSPSGTGIRIIFDADGTDYDKARYYVNNRKAGIEVYTAGCTEKFVTLTGNAIRRKGVEKRPGALRDVAEKYMRRPGKERPERAQNAPSGSFLSDEAVLSAARNARNGEAFGRLWDGDITGYPSASEADFALCSRLAFYCGGDTEQMDRLFRRSALYRDKWERADYRETTLRRAAEGCTEFYRPVRTNPEAERSETLKLLRRLRVIGNARYSENDMGFGRLFADVFRDVARYAEDRKRWFVYDGARWAADTAGLRVTELGKALADALIPYAASLRDEEQREKLLRWYRKWVQRKYRDVYIREAQSVYPTVMLSYDTDPYLFNCSNCTVDLRTGETHEHTPADMITRLSPVVYDPGASSERWERFIDEIMSGDREKARFLQKTLGYGLTGDTRYECMFIYYGETTRNGKGTLVESVLPVMGEYGITARPETISQKAADSRSPTEDIARLAGIRFANISEPSRGMLLNAAQLKNMTGNDTLNARYLNENSFDFKAQFKLYVNTNYLPVINDMTLFTSGRIVIVPFDRHFSEEEQDKGLKRAFLKPEVQSAILNWLIGGYRLLREEGFGQPDSVKTAVGAYFHDSDKTVQFTEDCLTADGDSEVRTAAVYDRYRTWCTENGCCTENSRNFLQELRKIGTVVRKRPPNGGDKTTILVGYRLRERNDFPY